MPPDHDNRVTHGATAAFPCCAGWLDLLPEACFVLDLEFRLSFVNRPAAALLGAHPDELPGKVPWEVCPALAGSPIEEICRRALAEGAAVTCVQSFPAARRRHQCTAFPAANRGVLLRAVARARRKTAPPRASPGPLRDVLDNIALLGVMLDRRGRITQCNGYLLNLTGWQREEVLQQSWFDLFLPPEIRPGIQRGIFLKSIASGSIPAHYRNAILTRSGERRLIDWSNTLIHDAGGGVTGVAAIGADVTERVHAEEELRKRNEFVEAVLENAPIGFAVNIISTGQRVFASRSFERIYGVEPGSLHSVDEYFEKVYHDPVYREEMRARIMADMATGDAARMRWEDIPITTHAGERRVVTAVNIPLLEQDLMISTVQDVTERKALEARLQQAHKMESVGRLAGGVAHDFNNLLTVINGYSEMLLGKLPAADPLRATVAEINKAGQRAAALTRQLLAFSRKQVLQPRLLDLNALLNGMRSLLLRLVGEDVEVRLELTAEGGLVHADPHQLEQVVMNLVVNSRDAMPQGGKLLIETAVVDLDENHVRLHADAHAGRFIRLSVCDTGLGMDEATQRKIFEPFFTTKGPGHGTGLGLAMVQGIVAQSGGHVDVQSEAGRGTTFRVYLPLRDGAAAADLETAAAGAVGGNETILVVEDQREVLHYTVTVLQSFGYQVVAARFPREALALCEQPAVLERIDLLLTDVVMPAISGRELAGQIVRLKPGLRVLYMSGYTDSVIENHGILDPSTHFIQKPFSPEQLAFKVREAIEAP